MIHTYIERARVYGIPLRSGARGLGRITGRPRGFYKEIIIRRTFKLEELVPEYLTGSVLTEADIRTSG